MRMAHIEALITETTSIALHHIPSHSLTDFDTLFIFFFSVYE